MDSADFKIESYPFADQLLNELPGRYFSDSLWPIVYLLYNREQTKAYVGETTDVIQRMGNHLRNEEKKEMQFVNTISSKKFNKSATLDIESKLIQYLHGDGKFTLLNGNSGIANHEYYQKNEFYWELFTEIWNDLRSKGICRHSLNYINNTNLFKYSPYKALTRDQYDGVKILMKQLLDDSHSSFFIEGSAGTGKTIMAIYLFALIKAKSINTNIGDYRDRGDAEFGQLVRGVRERYNDAPIALVVAMTSFRKTLQNSFKNIAGLKANMVIGPSGLGRQEYDLVLIDEAHRLRRRKNLTSYGSFDNTSRALGFDPETSTELKWVLARSKKRILFYDELQSVRPSDIEVEDFIELKRSPDSKVIELKEQLRSKGGKKYEKWLSYIFDEEAIIPEDKFHSAEYELFLFDHIGDMVKKIREREQEYQLSRLVAGFAWEWPVVGRDDPSVKTIKIEGQKFKWNIEPKDWINSEGAIDEVGCIHTTQGYDLNYAGVIFGNEISYDWEKKEIIIRKENYHDSKGKAGVKDIGKLKEYIINIYQTMMLRAIRGTYVYACDPDFKRYIEQFIPTYGVEEGRKAPEKIMYYENAVPLYRAIDDPELIGKPQEGAYPFWVKVPDNMDVTKEMFGFEIQDSSMDQIISKGSKAIFRKLTTEHLNELDGQIMLFDCSEWKKKGLRENYIIRELHLKKRPKDTRAFDTQVILKPLSNEKGYNEIILKREDLSIKPLGLYLRNSE